MVDAELRPLWAAVVRDFDRAKGLLPISPVESKGRLARLKEWFDHNKLELALDELEALGLDNAVPPAYWQALSAAAKRMGLEKHQPRITKLCT